MSDHSKIEWTDATWPMVTGCTKVSEGCRHCYAIRDGWRLSHHPNPKVSALYAGVVEQRTNKAETWLDWSGVVKVHADRLDWPLRWKRPRRIFVCNESDLFHEGVSDEFIDRIFAVMAASGRHQFQVLTKRPRRMLTYLLSRRLDATEYWPRPVWAKMDLDRFSDVVPTWPLSNVWLGVSVESRAHLYRIDHLRATPAAVRFLSLEPLLEDLETLDLRGISWVIVGGESGPQARPMHPDWVRAIRDQCQAAQVPFFFKQWGAWVPVIGQHGGPPHYQDFEHDLLVQRVGKIDCVPMRNVGKKAAGRLLDWRTWEEFPARREP